MTRQLSAKSKPRCPHEDVCTQDRPTKQGTVWRGLVVYVITGMVILFSHETGGLFLAIFTFMLTALWDFWHEPERDRKSKWLNYSGRTLAAAWTLISFIAIMSNGLCVEMQNNKRFLIFQSDTLIMNGATLILPIVVLNASLFMVLLLLFWDNFASKTNSKPAVDTKTSSVTSNASNTAM